MYDLLFLSASGFAIMLGGAFYAGRQSVLRAQQLEAERLRAHFALIAYLNADESQETVSWDEELQGLGRE